ncbi:hypothetical protein M378DRAFT_170767 [Amanita muscaria Koide BX008]|uniref:Uncharacterized protein n=2 Tax=Amanita muscaria (strain Koide BX008) TaxID=946122 RepID=A0A0C2S6G4_AMAMK|nr:hypothetical protein M378DRAFT_170767 [Amanita muscaria Koide BX008]
MLKGQYLGHLGVSLGPRRQDPTNLSVCPSLIGFMLLPLERVVLVVLVPHDYISISPHIGNIIPLILVVDDGCSDAADRRLQAAKEAK